MSWKKNILLTVMLLSFYLIINGQDDVYLNKDPLPSIRFGKNSITLTKKNKFALDSVIMLMGKCTGMSVIITGEPTSCNPKYSSRSWDRVNAIVNYIVSKGINNDRLIFRYPQDGESGVISLKLDSLQKNMTDPPHPNLLKRKNIIDTGKCDTHLLMDIYFKKGFVFLTRHAKKEIDSIAHNINQYPSCKFALIGYDSSCEGCLQLSWDRTHSVAKYLQRKGVADSRLIFYYGMEGGDPLSVTIRSASKDEDGPFVISAPHPVIDTIILPNTVAKIFMNKLIWSFTTSL